MVQAFEAADLLTAAKLGDLVLVRKILQKGFDVGHECFKSIIDIDMLNC